MDLLFSATVLQDRSELFMKRHIATALLVGMGMAVERPQLRAGELAQRNVPSRRIERQTVCRVSEFGHLKSAGRVRRAQIAKVFVDEGMLFAEWFGQVNAPEPRRIETEELDAEWMAHVKGQRWFLARRELVPSQEKMWSVQVYGDATDAATVRVIATAIEARTNGGADVTTAHFNQSAHSACLSLRGHHDGRPIAPWIASAPTLADLHERYPMIIETYLKPALAKMEC